MKAVVAQKGAREHFLAAKALHRRGSLACLLVDWYAPKGWLGKLLGFAVQRLGARGRAAMAAKAEEIPDDLVKVNWLNGLMGKWRQRSGRFRTFSKEKALVADIAFTKEVARTRLPEHNVFLGYSYMSLEMLEIENRKGVLTILDQIDPGRSSSGWLLRRWPNIRNSQELRQSIPLPIMTDSSRSGILQM